MAGVTKRIADLPAERRKLLERLLGKELPPASEPQVDSMTGNPQECATGRPPDDMTIGETAAGPQPPPPAQDATGAAIKAHHRRVYDRLNEQLNATPFAEHIRFCNYGYVSDGSATQSRVALPAHLMNKNTIALVLEVVGDCVIAGRDVLDVGCGRGGTISVLTTYFRPRRIAGIELSASAVAFCRRVGGGRGVSYHEGDAEQLPFPGESFDVVTNIESSHSYPAISTFYDEVERVLRPDGRFLYADLFPVKTWAENVRALERRSFVCDRDTDITQNVLLSCEQSAAGKLNAYSPANDPEFMRNFLGLPESHVYRGMQSGLCQYRIVALRKRTTNGADISPDKGSRQADR